MTTHEIINMATKKASKSICRYRVSAIGLNKKGEIIATATNRPRFPRHGASVHAEMNLMLHSSKGLKTIIICRIGSRGNILPIDPCESCAEKAKELGIKIISIR